MKRFETKVAVVTGAGGGIGSAICARLAQEGAQVVVADVDKDATHTVAAEIVAQGGKAIPAVADISQGQACAELIAGVITDQGGLDLLVNNSGINRRGNLLPPVPGGIAAHDRGRRRGHRQHGVAMGAVPGSQPYCLQRDQGRRGVIHPEPGA